MITVNCAAFSENLIESELFGYDLYRRKQGRQNGAGGSADGGTLINSCRSVLAKKNSEGPLLEWFTMGLPGKMNVTWNILETLKMTGLEMSGYVISIVFAGNEINTGERPYAAQYAWKMLRGLQRTQGTDCPVSGNLEKKASVYDKGIPSF